MTLNDILKKSIKLGIEFDPRSEEDIKLFLDDKKENIHSNIYFDKEELFNPYLDSSVHYDNGKEIKKVFIGIDTEVQEIVLADKLGADLILGHHPEGKALLQLAKVMNIHEASLVNAGISVNVAEKLVYKRQLELNKRLHSINYNRAIDAAKLLDISFMNLHTIADNIANKFIENYIEKNNFKTLYDFTNKVIKDIKEYEITMLNGFSPSIISGEDDSRFGKVFVKFNGGTSGNKKIFKYLEEKNISTFVCMHLPDEQLKEAIKYNINVITMPHMASDSLGMNLLLDSLIKNNNLDWEIINGSGFIRFSREDNR